MSNSGMQPQPSRPARPARTARTAITSKTSSFAGEPSSSMSASLSWASGGVTISFPADDFYPDVTSQEWTWNTTSKSEAAATRSDSFATSNATGNTLTVVQTRPTGAVTFKASNIARNASTATLAKQ
jgi:hypothetical protein